MAEQICPNCGHPYQKGDSFCRNCRYDFSSSIILPSGTILQGKYEVQRLIQSGGMGNIYLAKNNNLFDRLFILKQVRELVQSESQRKRLEEEALRMSKLNHPQIAILFDQFIESGYYFLVVERILGKTLNEVFREHSGRLNEDDVVRWATSMCGVVAYIHSEGIIHRDISPDNIMLTKDGNIKFIDFGTLRELRSIASGKTAGMGKYGYTPPEQWQGKPEPRSDIFALGATIYYLLTGFLPLSTAVRSGQSPQKEDFNPRFPPARVHNTEISPALEAILEKALQLDIDKRYDSAIEMQNSFLDLISGVTRRIPEIPYMPSESGQEAGIITSGQHLRWQTASSAIQHLSTLLPLAFGVLAAIYLFVLSPVFGEQLGAIPVIAVSAVAAVASYFYRYKKEYHSKIRELKSKSGNVLSNKLKDLP